MRNPMPLAIFLLLAGAALAAEPLPTAADLLERSLEHHDPSGAWSSRPLVLTVETTYDESTAEKRGYAIRHDRVTIDNSTGRFTYESQRGEDRIHIAGTGETFEARLNGSTEIAEADRQKFRLAPDRLPFMRDYMTYVFGLPMKLRDPGTRLDPEVQRGTFAGRDVLVLRVTYSPEVGRDTWYFYVDPQTAALAGCRFYHDESANDGEYIVYEDEVEGPDGLRLPKLRHWYINQDGAYLATDKVVSIASP